ncbi:hypothetical protein Pcinc_005248 [Petrolisthes cinctipes]|uniref:Gem-associated protein 8 n=1 Tax=Petrolisthes cinctipes TaxID=88211 RepID=A0AAE1GJU1_PETCI|nr:hypothetical protein Pcinc_005248 [Petrolisthes cinctipes]
MQNKKYSSKSTGEEAMWYNDQRFSVFWQHYNTMMMMGHYDAYTRATAVHQRTKHMLSSVHHQPPRTHRPMHQGTRPRNTNSSSHTKKRSKAWRQKRNKRKRKPFKPQTNLSDTETLYSQMNQQMHIQDLSGDEENMDVSDDFLKFMEQSVRHREEYRVLLQQTEETPDNDINTTPAHGDTSVPKEHPDVRRSREMKELYGEAAPRIHAMETALQLSFDRISTLHRPQFWPNIPLII